MNVYLAVVFCLLTVFAAQGQTADEVISRHANAIGGKKNLDEIKNLQYSGTALVDSNKLNYSLLIVKDRTYLGEISFQGMSIVTCLEDSFGWEINPLEGITEPKAMDEVSLGNYKLLTRTPDELVNYKDYKYKVEGIEKKKDGDKDCFVITLLRDGHSKISYYINAETYLLQKSVEKVKDRDGEYEKTLLVKEYQTVDGVKLPANVDVLRNGKLEYNLTCNLKANIKVADSRLKGEY